MANSESDGAIGLIGALVGLTVAIVVVINLLLPITSTVKEATTGSTSVVTSEVSKSYLPLVNSPNGLVVCLLILLSSLGGVWIYSYLRRGRRK